MKRRVVKKDGNPWGAVVDDVLRIDVESTYRKLVGQLTLGSDATEYGPVLRALDESARNAWEASRLVRAAKLEDERVGGEVDERLEVMRTQARKDLEKEKREQRDQEAEKAGKKPTGPGKPPTLQEVEDRILADYTDEVVSLRRRKAEMHAALRSVEGLERSWRDRCSQLSHMLARHRA